MRNTGRNRPERMRVLGLGALLIGGCGEFFGPVSTSSSGDSMTSDLSTGAATGEPMTTTTTTTPTTTTPTTGEGGTTTTGETVCSGDAECVQAAGECRTGVCDAGICVLMNRPEDTPIADAPGNCRRVVCDGAGQVKEMPDDSDLALDDPGNCKTTVCMAGQPGFVADDLDLPDDGVECTLDECAQGTPKFTARPANSFCGAMGAKFCHDDTSCRDCKQVSEACEDDSGTEANETQATAHKLGTIIDADAAGSFVCAVLDGADDVDWYTFKGDDALFNFVDPTREVISDFNHRICVYIVCDNGEPSIGCGGDETVDVAPLGQSGCCGVGNVSPSLDCQGTDDSATIWVKVENTDGLACVPYELTYHF
jgi:hypothetical protein